MTIGGISSPSNSSGTVAAAPISTALQAQVSSSQSANIEALFGSLGLGVHTNTHA
jgi:hypothetical protein